MKILWKISLLDVMEMFDKKITYIYIFSADKMALFVYYIEKKKPSA